MHLSEKVPVHMAEQEGACPQAQAEKPCAGCFLRGVAARAFLTAGDVLLFLPPDDEPAPFDAGLSSIGIGDSDGGGSKGAAVLCFGPDTSGKDLGSSRTGGTTGAGAAGWAGRSLPSGSGLGLRSRDGAPLLNLPSPLLAALPGWLVPKTRCLALFRNFRQLSAIC